MNMIDFVTKVRETREAQRDYFRGRMQTKLVLAKSLEQVVDKALMEGVTLYATSTLEKMDGTPAEGEQLGMFDEPDAVLGDSRPQGGRWQPEAASPDDLLDLSGE